MKIENVIYGDWFIQYEVTWNKWSKLPILVRIEAITFRCIDDVGIFVSRFETIETNNGRDSRWFKR